MSMCVLKHTLSEKNFINNRSTCASCGVGRGGARNARGARGARTVPATDGRGAQGCFPARLQVRSEDETRWTSRTCPQCLSARARGTVANDQVSVTWASSSSGRRPCLAGRPPDSLAANAAYAARFVRSVRFILESVRRFVHHRDHHQSTTGWCVCAACQWPVFAVYGNRPERKGKWPHGDGLMAARPE